MVVENVCTFKQKKYFEWPKRLLRLISIDYQIMFYVSIQESTD